MTDSPVRPRSRALFWGVALLWLPAGVVLSAAIRFGSFVVASGMWPTMSLTAFAPLFVAAPCGLPLALACRRLGRLEYRRTAWVAGVALGAATVAASPLAGLFGLLGIAVVAVLLSLPLWVAALWLGRKRRAGNRTGPPPLDERDRAP